MDDPLAANRRLWNEWAEINARSAEYDVDRFKTGGLSLHGLEQEEVGDVAGQSLLHLQCHFGLDTLSWARLGASVTGVDFSERAIEIARGLSAEMDIPARFICCNLYDLPAHLDETFDIVFTSIGALCWLPDLTAWARLVARYLKPGGMFYVLDMHPFAWVFDDTDPSMPITYPYFAAGPQTFEVEGSYADREARVNEPLSYEWVHPLGQTINALIEAGLRIEWLHEFPFAVFQPLDFMERSSDGLWRLPGGKEMIPLMFSIKALKP